MKLDPSLQSLVVPTENNISARFRLSAKIPFSRDFTEEDGCCSARFAFLWKMSVPQFDAGKDFRFARFLFLA